MSLKIYIILLLSLVYSRECVGEFPIKKCPDDSPCTPITECPGMLEFLQSDNPEKIDQIRKNTCGFTGKRSIHVCCKSECTVIPLGKDLLPEDCGMPDVETVDPFIHGGEIAPRGAYPWMVAIMKEAIGYNFICAGSLINERYVLTAAHCVHGKEDLSKLLHIGEWNQNTDIDCDNSTEKLSCSPHHTVAGIEEIIIHPHYSHYEFLWNDIALVRLNMSVPLTSSYIKAVCLPPQDLDPELEAQSKELIAMGWGRTENMSESDVLLRVNLPFSERKTCKNIFGCNFIDTQLCIGGEKGKSSCKGDSGGSLVLPERPYVQVGIASAGYFDACGSEGFPVIYTSVSSYTDWILQNLKP